MNLINAKFTTWITLSVFFALVGCKGSFDATITKVNKTVSEIDKEAPLAVPMTVPAFDEDIQRIVTLGYVDPKNELATSCAVTSLSNLTVSQVCSCDMNGACTVGIKGLPDYSGDAKFEYTIAKSTHISQAVPAYVKILAVNDAPKISLNMAAVSGNENSSINNVVATISDIDSSIACSNISVATGNSNLIPASNVSISGSSNTCSISIAPMANQSGSATLSFSIKDPQAADGNIASLSVNVLHLDRAPIASAVVTPSSLNEDTFGSIKLGYSDVEGDKATSCSVSVSTNLTISSPCSCDSAGICSVGLMGSANFNGVASFNYSVTANSKISNVAMASLTIAPVNDAPTMSLGASNLSLAYNSSSTVSAAIADVDSSLACSNIVLSSNNSSLIPSANLSVSGTAPTCIISIKAGTNQSGPAVVTALLSDSANASVLKTINVTIAADSVAVANAVLNPAAVNEDTVGLITLGYSDSDGDKATACSVTPSSNLSIASACACDAAGVCKVGLAGILNFNGAASFTYNVTTNAKVSNSANASLNIIAVNDAPVLSLASNTLALAYNGSNSVAANISDVDSSIACSNIALSSSNTTLVPSANLTISGTAPSCSINVKAGTNQSGSVVVTALLNDGAGASVSKTINVTIAAAPLAITLPAKIEAENFVRYSDTTAGNGFQELGCRQGTDVDMELAFDTIPGGCNIGQAVAGEYLEYDISSATAKNYDFSFRMATANSGFKFKVQLDGVDLTSGITVSQTNWQIYNDYKIANVPVSAGSHVLKFIFLNNDINFNYFSATVAVPVDAVAVSSGVLNPASIDEDSSDLITLGYSDSDGDKATACSVTPTPNLSISSACACDVSGVCKVGLSGALNFNGVASFNYNVTTNSKVSNSANASVNILAVNDAPVISLASSSLALAHNGNSSVAANISDIDSSIACSNIALSSSNTTLVPNANLTMSGTAPSCSINVKAGTNQSGSVVVTALLNDGAGASVSKTINVSIAAPAVNGQLVPALIHASSFDRSNDIEAANLGSAECTKAGQGVDLGMSNDQWGFIKNKCNIGWTRTGEWVEYDIYNNDSGKFKLNFRVATSNTTKKFKASIDGVNVTGDLVTPAHGWQTYNDVASPEFDMPAGSHKLRVEFIDNDTNFLYVSVLRPNDTKSNPISNSVSMAPGETKVVKLSYSDNEKDKGQFCLIRDVQLVTISSDCLCSNGSCEVSLTTPNDSQGKVGSFRFYVVTAGLMPTHSNDFGFSSSVNIFKQNTPPQTYFLDTVLAQKNEETFINLNYVDADGDLANICSVSGLSNLTVTSPCACYAGICSVGVKGNLDYIGLASFSYKVMDYMLYSNETNVSFNIQSSVNRIIASTKTKLPIEVFSHDENKEVETVTVYADEQATSATDLYLRVHRGRWMETGDFKDQGAKMSVSLNGGSFYPIVGQKYADSSEFWGVNDPSRPGRDVFALTPSSVDCVKADAQFGGCLVGAYHTTRFKIKLNKLGALNSGANTIAFRFEGTNGEEMGYRVLNIDALAGNKSVLVPNQFEQDDPNTWTPPKNTAQDIADGKNLFETATLYDSPINKGKILNAKCISCHAIDGRDLAYFNFSNKSIVYRSMFHGLTEDQGQKIASYIRSVNLKIPSGYSVKDLGRPWNPPYQPGPGLDSKPQMLWSAGAGIDSVLDSDTQMRDYLFSGQKVSFIGSQPKTMDINGYKGYTNPRETPQAIQFPDWMQWLPKIAPEDRMSNPNNWYTSQVWQRFLTLKTNLATPQGIANEKAHSFFNIRVFAETPHPTYDLSPSDVTRDSFTPEQSFAATKGYMALQTWFALRQWELFNTNGLEEITTPTVSGYMPNAKVIGMRNWPAQFRNVFHLAPHFSGPLHTAYPKFNNQVAMFNWTPVGQFFSTSWYSMQMIINAGYQMAAGQEHPVDWNYHPNHIAHTSSYGEHFPRQPYRWFASVQFMTQIQMPDMLTDPLNNYWKMQLFSFRHVFDGLGVAMADSLEKSKEIEVVNQSILTVIEQMENYPDVSVFPRKGDGRGQQGHAFEPIDTVVPLTATGFEDGFYGRKASEFFSATRNANILGVPATTVERMKAFGKKVWPQTDWDSIDTNNR